MNKTYFQALHYLIQLNGSSAFRNWLRVRANSSITKYSELPCSTLAGFNISTRLRKTLLDLGKELQIGDILEVIRFGARTSSTRKLWSSEKNKVDLCLACFHFLEMENTSEYHVRPISDSIDWIIPDTKFKDAGILGEEFNCLVDKLVVEHFGQGVIDWKNWMPWVSLSISRNLKTWRSPKINCIDRAIFKLPRSVGLDSECGEPWAANYPEFLSNLPLPVVYQCERDKKTLDAISQLSGIGLKKVNDLRIFHPESIAFCKDIRDPHKIFYNEFNF